MEKITVLLLCCSLISVGKGICPKRGQLPKEEGRTCRKECRRHADCSARNKECYCDSECGMSCFNKNFTCAEPEAIAHGSVTRTNLQLGGVARYRCNDGYVLEGRRTRKCNADKKWGGDKPTCEGCSRPNDVDNSYPSERRRVFLIGEEYRFSCYSGYYVEGNPIRTCRSLEEGWTEPGYSCRIKRCGFLPGVDNGRIDYTKRDNFGSTAKVVCNEGYESTSDRKVKRCYAGDPDSAYGEWTGSLPSCRITTCEAPEEPIHGSIRYLDDLIPEYGIEITYQCDRGYKIKGPEVGRCNKDRNWGEAPKCIANADCHFTDSTTPFCGYKARNWRRERTRDSHGLAGYAALSGVGNPALESVTLPGGWAEDYICLRFLYKLSPGRTLHVESADFDATTFLTTHSNEVTAAWLSAAVTINFRRDLTFQFRTDGSQVYLDDVTVVPESCENYCERAPCQNGGVCFNRINDYTCFCTRGYEGPRCENELTCKHAESERNRRVLNPRSKWLAGDTVEYQCQTGYIAWNEEEKVRMPTSASCLENGHWSNDPPHCIRPYCTYKETSGENSAKVMNSLDRYPVGSDIYFKCQVGHKLVGPPSLQCIGTGRWSGDKPRCTKVSCPSPPQIHHGHYTNRQNKEYAFGDSIQIGCQSGYFRHGTDRKRCLWNGTWSELPICNAISDRCPNNFRPPENGYFDRGSNKKIKIIQCYPRFNSPSSPVNIYCGPGNAWYGEKPTCDEILPRKRAVIDGLEYLAYQNVRIKYENAQRWCRAGGGNLAIIYSEGVNNQIVNQILNTVEGYVSMMIGLKRAGRGFEWDASNIRINFTESQKTSPYRAWHPFQDPNQHNRRCAILWNTKGNVHMQERGNPYMKRWYKTFCNYKHGFDFLCQKTPEPCRPNPCRNGGKCKVEEGRASCNCSRKYKGEHCETEIKCDFKQLAGGFKHMSKRFHSIGEIVPLICDEGFSPDFRAGYGKATCQPNGQWQRQGSCREIFCEDPPLPRRRRVQDGAPPYRVGSVIYIGCAGEYELQANGVMQCQRDGTWTVLQAECIEITCEPPRIPSGAYFEPIQTSYSVGSSVSVFCHENYRNDGVRSLECRRDRTWNPLEDQVACSVRQNSPCDVPDLPSHSYFDDDRRTFPSGSSITFGCETGYSIAGGQPTWSCSNAMWDKTDARCDADEPCREPELPKHSLIVDGLEAFPSGRSISLACRGGREISGNGTWLCNNGTWIETDVTCVALFCRLDPLSVAAYDLAIQDRDEEGDATYTIGTEVTLTCLYAGSPRHFKDTRISPTITCGEDGIWSPTYQDFVC